jgi:hypothetical protein
MGSLRTIDVEERRARLWARHHLARRAETVEAAVDGVVALHSSDPIAVYLSARARVDGFAVEELEDALYSRRSLVRMLGMRRTMFVVPTALAGIVDAACTRALVPGQRRRLIALVEEQGIADDGGRWVEAVADRTYEALVDLGQATATELTKRVPELGLKVTYGEGRSWGGTGGMSTRVLSLLATEGRIVRARPLGSWVSSQYRWAPTSTWITGGLPDRAAVEARTELLRAWLAAFGPGTEVDVRWWTGWTARQARAALADLDAVEVALDAGSGWLLADDLDPPATARRRVAFLPALDPTVMGWKERDWFLGTHGSRLFDTNGNAGATVWVDGRVVGGWAQHPDGQVEARLLEGVDAEAGDLIDEEATALTAWLDGTTVTPRFRTPLERQIVTERGRFPGTSPERARSGGAAALRRSGRP